MANFFREEIDQMGDRLNGSIRLAGTEITAQIRILSEELTSHRKEGIVEVAERLDQSIRLAGTEIQNRIEVAGAELTAQRREGVAAIGERLDQSIRLAGSEIRERIEEISRELHTHRSLSKDDLKEVIDYAALSFGSALDQRIDKLKQETSSLVTVKVGELRDQLSAAAEEQKRNTLRNVSITIAGSIMIGVLSLVYQRVLHGDLNLINIFRAIFFTLASAQLIWVAARAIQRYRKAPAETKKLAFTAIHYFGVIRPQGVAGHLGIFLLLAGALAVLNFWGPIASLLAGGH